VYDPAAGVFRTAGAMATPRSRFTGAVLNTGAILLVGGYDNGFNDLASAELFQPGVLTPTGLVSISVNPASASVPLGSSQQFVATGTFSDSSTQTLASALWTSSNASVASISNEAGNHGVAVSAAAGTATILAAAGSVGGSAMLNVTAPVLVSMAVTPVKPSITAGLTLQFSPTGNFTGKKTQDFSPSGTGDSSPPQLPTSRHPGL